MPANKQTRNRELQFIQLNVADAVDLAQKAVWQIMSRPIKYFIRWCLNVFALPKINLFLQDAKPRRRIYQISIGNSLDAGNSGTEQLLEFHDRLETTRDGSAISRRDRIWQYRYTHGQDRFISRFNAQTGGITHLSKTDWVGLSVMIWKGMHYFAVADLKSVFRRWHAAIYAAGWKYSCSDPVHHHCWKNCWIPLLRSMTVSPMGLGDGTGS